MFGSFPVIFGLLLLGALLVVAVSWRIRTVHLALGFAATASMWMLGYCAMLAPGLWFGELLFGATLGVLMLIGALARRCGASPVRVGLVSAFANLLIIGAFLRDEQGGSPWTAPLYILGLFGGSVALAAIGGLLARGARPMTIASNSGLFALVAAATIFILLVTGGLVTGLESGLAVPDWPNSFGHNMLLYPISEMKGGIYYEHAHRLFGMLVGTTALVLLVVVFREDRRVWIRASVVLFLAIICVQGALGGLRVTGNLTDATSGAVLQPSTALAITHGMLGQMVFAIACVLACAMSDSWKSARLPLMVADAARVRALPLLLLGTLVLQLFLGASYRHLQIPPHDGVAAVHPAWPIWGHIGVAMAILVLAAITGAHASSRAREIPSVRVLGQGIVHTVGLQLALGIAALVVVLMRADEKISSYEVIVTSAHQALGALLLAMTAMLAACSLRFVADPGAQTEVTLSA